MEKGVHGAAVPSADLLAVVDVDVAFSVQRSVSSPLSFSILER